MSLRKIIEWKLMNENLKPKVAIIMRGISGSGKSTKVRELLAKYGGTQDGHVFSTDRQFHPASNRLSNLDISKLTDDQALKEANDILNLWYRSKHSSVKEDSKSAFLDFKKLFDAGDYRGALNVAKGMHGSLESVEYRSNWDGAKLHGAHIRNSNEFKAAVDLGITPVIVDNTNTTIREMKSYVEYANAAGYEILIQEPDSPHWKQYRGYLTDKYGNKDKIAEFAQLLASKNTHGVPLDSIEKMLARWQHNVTVKDILDSK
jgi:predicted kinase